jgi:hypothetical protein
MQGISKPKQKQFAPLPPDCFGKPWCVKTLRELDSETLKALIRKHSAGAINAALSRSK